MDTPERVSANKNLLPKTHTFLHDETALKMPSESVMLACINPNQSQVILLFSGLSI